MPKSKYNKIPGLKIKGKNSTQKYIINKFVTALNELKTADVPTSENINNINTIHDFSERLEELGEFNYIESFYNDYLASLGAREISRYEFLNILIY